eukprot:COSAG05_NODE_685_length_7933_cov_622.457110_8_plen_56_part_00
MLRLLPMDTTLELAIDGIDSLWLKNNLNFNGNLEKIRGEQQQKQQQNETVDPKTT